MKSALVAALLFCLVRITAAGERTLNLFIWSEYLDPAVVTDFEKEFQCKVVIDLYEDSEGMLAKLQGAGTGLYDVVVPSDYIVPALRKLDLLQPLRLGNISNLTNIEARFKNPPFDPGNKYTVAYQWGTVGIYTRKNAIAGQDPTWAWLFDNSKNIGKFALIDSMRDLIGAALKYKGYKLNSTDPKQLQEVRDLLVSAKKRALSLENSVGAKSRVISKAVQAGIVYSGEGARGMSDDPGTVYVIPKEGSQIWLDNLAVVSNAPHRDLAEQFINFMLRPQIGARISNYTQFSSPNRASLPFIKKELLNNPAIYPPPEVLARCEFLQDLGAQTRLYDEIWTQIKSR